MTEEMFPLESTNPLGLKTFLAISELPDKSNVVAITQAYVLPASIHLTQRLHLTPLEFCEIIAFLRGRVITKLTNVELRGRTALDQVLAVIRDNHEFITEFSNSRDDEDLAEKLATGSEEDVALMCRLVRICFTAALVLLEETSPQ